MPACQTLFRWNASQQLCSQYNEYKQRTYTLKASTSRARGTKHVPQAPWQKVWPTLSPGGHQHRLPRKHEGIQIEHARRHPGATTSPARVYYGTDCCVCFATIAQGSIAAAHNVLEGYKQAGNMAATVMRSSNGAVRKYGRRPEERNAQWRWSRMLSTESSGHGRHAVI